MIKTVFMVAAGGALGAVLRFLWGLGILRLVGVTPFPVAILAANVLGSFLMGIVAALVMERGLSHLAPFLMTGVLGGFTTFSAFSLEAVTMMERGDLGLAGAYVVLSVGLSIMGLFLGLMLVRGSFA